MATSKVTKTDVQNATHTPARKTRKEADPRPDRLQENRDADPRPEGSVEMDPRPVVHTPGS